MTEAKLGQGTLLQRYVAGSYVTIAEITKLGGPDMTAEDVDVTSHDSVGGFKEFISGLKEGGEVTFDANFVPDNATHQRVISDFAAGTQAQYQIVFPSPITAKWQFLGHVKGFKASSDPVNALSFSGTLKIDGYPTLSSETAPNLTALAVTTGVLAPVFAAATKSYGCSVANGVTSVTVTPTCATADTIKVNGAVVASGSASGAIDTAIGNTLVTIDVYKAGYLINTYTINIFRAS